MLLVVVMWLINIQKDTLLSGQENKYFLLIQILYLCNSTELIKHCNLHFNFIFYG